ncbi:MAG: efflux RND transporter permease subunit [Rickettsiales bacterium]|nr:efflux RND transporter permease subunit [Rickettsiales bacterium]
MSKFFIKRPIFSWVLAIIVMLAGLLSIFSMPVEQYPNIAPPTVSISTSLPGASAKVLEDSVTQIIEQNLSGIDYLRYFESSSDSDGNVKVVLTFEPEADVNIAQVQVQNKLQAAMPLLPIEVQQQGVRINKANNNFLLVVALYSKDDRFNQADLGDILLSDLKDSIARIDGVGNVIVFGNPKAMRIWVDPIKLFTYSLNISEVVSAIREQNIDVSTGQLGGLPAVDGQQINAVINSKSKLHDVAAFNNIIIRAKEDGSIITLGDVATVELGSDKYSTVARYKRHPASGMAVVLASGANALETADLIKKRVSEIEKFLPKGVGVVYPYDSTPFIKLSIKGVVKTLFEAVCLVFLVMLLFLQNFRATLVPTIAIPVVLLGTFAVLNAFGFTINTLTMFAVVLVIGLLVDDAIVVVENVERVIHEENMDPRQATKLSMKQITSALIGIALVLSAVFVPMAFFGGLTGKIYQQFSVTIVVAMALSVLVALILSPSLCATILQNKEEHEKGVKFKVLQIFNQKLEKFREVYVTYCQHIIDNKKKGFVIYGVVIILLVLVFRILPTAFLPSEDQGTMYLMTKSPAGATIDRSLDSLKKVEDYFLDVEKDNVDHLFTVAGFSFAGRAQNVGFGFVGLKEWEKRKGSENSVEAISNRAFTSLQEVKDALVFTFSPPPIRELGTTSGFDLQLLDRSGKGHNFLMEARNQLLEKASLSEILAGVRPEGLEDVAEYQIDIDDKKAMSLGVSVSDVNDVLQVGWGSLYVNDFIDKGRVKKVYLQGLDKYRMMPDDLSKWYIKNKDSQMVQLTNFAKGKWSYGSPKLERFAGFSSASIKGSGADGVSSGEAIAKMEALISELPDGVDHFWSGISYEEKRLGSRTLILYAISILVVFLSLAALYESWTIPFSVIMVVPFGVLGSVVMAKLCGMNNDVYFQIGLLTTIGLSAKNAILIVEFARDLTKQGVELVDAVLRAATLRFRPILMTSMAFLLGIIPLATSTGAGSASQKAISIGIIGGMLMATFVATLFVPMFFVVMQKLGGKK